MLTQEEIREIEDEAAHYPQSHSACIEALKIVQRRRGWISDDALRDLAEFLGMTADELDGVATFYPLLHRQPVGRHVIRLCDSVSCWIMGYGELYSALTEKFGIRFGETSADGRFTLLPSACLGACDHAPAVMIDGDLILDWNTADLDRVLSRYP